MVGTEGPNRMEQAALCPVSRLLIFLILPPKESPSSSGAYRGSWV